MKKTNKTNTMKANRKVIVTLTAVLAAGAIAAGFAMSGTTINKASAATTATAVAAMETKTAAQTGVKHPGESGYCYYENQAAAQN